MDARREEECIRWAVERTRMSISELAKRHYRRLDYYVTQMLTGHGSFDAYTFKFKKTDGRDGKYCGKEDTAIHTIFECPRWQILRQGVECKITPNHLIGKMMEKKENWDADYKIMRRIMERKENNEKDRQSGK